MFTGIIRHIGQVTDVRASQARRRLTIDIGPLSTGLAEGDSVAVNGLCLTASAISATRAEFDVIAESLSKSTLGDLRAGSRVNLERALPADGRLDGHIVQGHVDGTAAVTNIRKADQWVIEFKAERSLVDQMVPKGSIAINGVSLTLVDAGEDTFSVAIIPKTLADTTLPNLAIAERVNIETDIVGKFICRYLQTLLANSTGQPPATPGGLTMEKLKQAGFM